MFVIYIRGPASAREGGDTRARVPAGPGGNSGGQLSPLKSYLAPTPPVQKGDGNKGARG